MAAPKNNDYWKKRKSHGRRPRFATPEQLWSECVQYFEWSEATPLKKAVLVTHRGESKQVFVSKMRAFSITGLCVYLKITHQTFAKYRNKDEFKYSIECVEAIIYEQKFTGAAAGLLNPVIIARDLALRKYR